MGVQQAAAAIHTVTFLAQATLGRRARSAHVRLRLLLVELSRGSRVLLMAETRPLALRRMEQEVQEVEAAGLLWPRVVWPAHQLGLQGRRRRASEWELGEDQHSSAIGLALSRAVAAAVDPCCLSLSQLAALCPLIRTQRRSRLVWPPSPCCLLTRAVVVALVAVAVTVHHLGLDRWMPMILVWPLQRCGGSWRSLRSGSSGKVRPRLRRLPLLPRKTHPRGRLLALLLRLSCRQSLGRQTLRRRDKGKQEMLVRRLALRRAHPRLWDQAQVQLARQRPLQSSLLLSRSRLGLSRLGHPVHRMQLLPHHQRRQAMDVPPLQPPQVQAQEKELERAPPPQALLLLLLLSQHHRLDQQAAPAAVLAGQMEA